MDPTTKLVEEKGGEEKKETKEISVLLPNKTGKTEQFIEENSVVAPRWRQILVVLGISFGCYIQGTSVVWPIVLPKLISNSNATAASLTGSEYTGYTIDPQHDVAWIVSIYVLGNFLGSVISAPLSNTVGRRWTCILGVALTFGVSYILVITATQVSMLYLSRVLMGTALGVTATVSTVYIQDVSTPDIRGSLGAVPAVTGALGVFTFQMLNAFMDWRNLNIFCACLSMPYFVFLLVAPESPVYLVSRKKLDAARKALRTLRGPEWDVGKEIEEIQSRLDASGSSKSKSRLSFRAFLNIQVLKPVFISFMLLFLMNMTGISAIISYSVQIFQTANSSINEFIATVYLGLALLASNILTVLLAHKLPRRMMLMVSAMGISITLAVMGLIYQLDDWVKQCEKTGQKTHEECSYGDLGWLPLLNLMVYIFVYNLGYGAMVFITASEILPPHTRELGMSLCVSLSCPVSFMISYTFPLLLTSIKGQGVFWLYSAVSLAGFVFVSLAVPETRGKTDAEIQQHFGTPSPGKTSNTGKMAEEEKKMSPDIA